MRERKPVRALSCKAARQKNCGGEGLGYKCEAKHKCDYCG